MADLLILSTFFLGIFIWLAFEVALLHRRLRCLEELLVVLVEEHTE